MKIPITDDYVMTSDACNFILNEVPVGKKGKNTGKQRLKPVAYYSRVEDLVEGLIDRKMVRSTKRTLKAFLQEHRDLCKEIRALAGAKNERHCC